MAFVTDISGRVEQDRQMRHIEKLAALGSMAAGIAHELNNPVGIILSRLEVMLLEGEEQHLAPESLVDLQVLHRHAQRLGHIAQSLLSFGRQRQLDHDAVDLADDRGRRAALRGQASEPRRDSRPHGPRSGSPSSLGRFDGPRASPHESPLERPRRHADRGHAPDRNLARASAVRGNPPGGVRHGMRHVPRRPGQARRALLHDQAGWHRPRPLRHLSGSSASTARRSTSRPNQAAARPLPSPSRHSRDDPPPPIFTRDASCRAPRTGMALAAPAVRESSA